MGDRCYMEVYCRKADKAVFEELGFDDQECEDTPGVAWLIDYEANYAHCGDLPTNIVWHGSSEAGGDYGPSDYACDGETLQEIATAQAGGYVVSWDNTTNQPTASDVRDIQLFREHYAKVVEMLKAPVAA